MVLSQYQKISIMMMHAAGIKTQRQIAQKVKCSQSSVSETISKFKTHRTIDILPGRGRKRETDSRTDRRMKITVARSKSVVTSDIKSDLNAMGIAISNGTIKNRLHEKGYYGYIKRKVPMISKKNELKRKAYAKKYQNHPNSFWSNIMYVDEKKFELIPKHRREIIWRQKNRAYDVGNTKPYTRSQSVMVWACFGAAGVGNIVLIPNTMSGAMYREILKKNFRESAQKIGLKRGWYLLQDNDPKHKSKIVQTELDKMKIKRIDHPAQSPDLNPIENLWDVVDRKIPTEDRNSIETFTNAIIREWNNIAIETCRNLAMSMRDRMKEVLEMKGRATHY